MSIQNTLTATFSEPMAPATINTTTFTLMHGAVSVDGAVSISGSTAVFNPTDNLLPNTLYTATISTDARATAKHIAREGELPYYDGPAQ